MNRKVSQQRLVIIIAEDDEDDRLLLQEAFREASTLPVEISFVKDGVELLDYLYRRGNFAGDIRLPQPELVLLDLNMPRMGGMEVLDQIKRDPALRAIPVVVLTTSHETDHVLRSYELGGNGFITKPDSYSDLVRLIGNLERYWFGTVRLR